MSSRSSLNHIYRTVWNEALGAVVAVAETATCNRGTASCTVAGSAIVGGIPAFAPSALVLALALAWGITPQAHANPTGGVAIQGQATMATKGNVLTVTTQNGAGTNHSSINWQSFSIPAGNVTRFDQPNAASTSINRVVTNTPSVLFGTLSSNGKVVLVNQSGIAVGAGAVVDTAGFTAAAMKMSETDAISGRLRFDGSNSSGSGLLGVQGNIISRGGDVVLIAPSIELAKNAVVESQGGSVVLAAGQKVEVTGRGLEGISLQVQAPTDQALNLGTLKGDAVGIFAGTLKHSGSIQATQASVEGGKVVLKAAGDAYVEGNAGISASSDNGKGGTVAVLGQRVAVTDNARIDASGTTGGGTILVGGDYQGKNPDVQNASVTYVGPNTELKADAKDTGNGGKVIVWSDDTTRAYGSLSARGGAIGGDGGFVETSGKRYLDYQGQVDTQAPKGKFGTLLLDPFVVSISNGTLTNMPVTSPFAPIAPDSASILPVSILTGALSSTNVLVDASASSHSQIDVASPVSWTSPNSLTLKTNTSGGIYINAGITATTPGANLILDAGSEGISQTAPIQVTGLKVISAGNVNLSNAGNSVGKIAGSVTGTGSGFQLENISNLEIGSVDSTNGLGVTDGDVTLKVATLNGLLKISSPVTATAGNVIYVADNIAHNATTTTSSVSGKFAHVYPFTAATAIDLGLPSDGAGILRLDNVELNNFKTPLLKVGNSPATGAISIVAPIAPNATSYSSMSLITYGTISQTPSSTISIANLNADGGAGVTLTESNAVTNLAGHTQSGNFAFTNSGDLNISKVDVISGVESAVSGNITLTSSTGKVTQDSNGPLKSTGTLTVSAQNGILLSTVSNTIGTGVNLTNSNTGNLEYKGSMSNVLEVTATNVSGNTTINAAGPFLKANNVSSNSGNVTITGSNDVKLAGTVVSTSGNVSVTATSGQIINVSTSHSVTGTQINLTAGTDIGGSGAEINVNATGFVNAQAANGSVYLSSAGNLPLASITGNTATGVVDLKSLTGAITDANSTANNIAASSLQLSAYSGIGSSDAIETQVSTLSASTTMAGDIAIANSGTVMTLGTLSPASANRWLIYANDPSQVIKGGNTSVFRRYNNATPPTTGNGFVYASAPGTVTVDATLVSGSANHTYGSTPTAVFGESLVNSSSYDSEDFALISVNATAGLTFTPTIASTTNAGAYSVLYASGLTSTAGYSFVPGAAVAYTVNPAALTAVTAALTGSATKTYDGTTTATLVPANFQLTGFINSDSANVTKTSGTYASRDVGSSILVSTSLTNADFTPVGSTLLSNYSLPTSANGNIGRITPALLIITSTADKKTYDGTVNSSALPTSTGLVSGDTITGLGQTYDNRNAGTGKILSAATGYTINDGNSGSNYTVAIVTSNAGVIAPAPLAITATANTKTYDGTTSSSSLPTPTGLVSGDTITGLGQTYDNRNAGTGKTLSVSTGYAINDGNSGNNYTVTTANSSAGIITPAPLAITATANTKTYDGTTSSSSLPTSTGLVSGDTITGLGQTYDNRNAGTGKTLIVSTGYTINDGNAGNNYTVTTANSSVGIITSAPLTITASDASKTFGQTLSFIGNEFSASGLQNGETIGSVALSSTGAVASASVAGGPYPIIPSNASGGTFSPSNYSVTYVNGVLTVTPAPLTAVTAALTGTTTKTYDGTTTAALTPANFLLRGFVNGDAASVTKTTGDYASKNVGSNLMVSTSLASSDFAPAGSTQLSNYSLPTSASGPIGSITSAPLTVTAKDASKTFGQTLSFIGNEFSASGLQNGETIGSVSLSSTGAVASASVAGGPYPIIPSNANGGTFSPSNYSVTYINGVLTVTPAPLTAVTATLTGSTTKTYDGTTTATLTPANFLLNGFVDGDSASVTKTTGDYASKNVGSNLMVSTSLANSDFAPTESTQLSNYSLPTNASGPIGAITPAPLTVTAKDASKTFGQTLSFSGSEFSASGLRNGETIGSVALSSTGAVASASVAGGPYPIIPSNASGGTFSPSNYSVTYVNGVLTVTPAPLTAVTAALTGSTTKTYDGTTTATLTPANFLLGGFVNGDSASVTKTTGDYASKNVGSNLMVSTSLANSDFAPAGSTQLSNYSLPASASGPIGAITPAPLTVTAKDASKTFGQTLSFSGSEFSASGLRNGETIGSVALSSTGAVASASVAGGPYPIIPSNASGAPSVPVTTASRISMVCSL
ncbi:MAG: filamentous hemagglutinin N-terminal domain-containing protein [Rhodoferax sp.]|nr:filamentous hemagglutinin N-terminal domain-containing protein [Rhodoferax sp.]